MQSITRQKKWPITFDKKNSGILKVLHMAPHQHYCGKREKEKKSDIDTWKQKNGWKRFFFVKWNICLKKITVSKSHKKDSIVQFLSSGVMMMVAKISSSVAIASFWLSISSLIKESANHTTTDVQYFTLLRQRRLRA